MGAFTSALAAVGIGMQAVGTIKAGQDAQAAAEYNAATYRAQADAIDIKKQISEQSWDRLIKQLDGQSTVAVASSGYDYSGSFLEVVNDRMTQAYLDKNIESYNLELAKSQSLSAADEAIRKGKAARSAALWSAGGSLLTQGNEWYSKYGGTKSLTNTIDPSGGINGGLLSDSKYDWAKDYQGAF
jgi:hypothetical protein